MFRFYTRTQQVRLCRRRANTATASAVNELLICVHVVCSQVRPSDQSISIRSARVPLAEIPIDADGLITHYQRKCAHVVCVVDILIVTTCRV